MPTRTARTAWNGTLEQGTGQVAAAGGTPRSLDVQADVTLGPDEDGFRAAAEKAEAGCPVSKALTGTTITVGAGLE